MKNILLVILPLLSGSFSLIAQNTGIGTVAPENTLHVFKGSAGVVTAHPEAPLIVENSTSCYIHVLAPNVNESGIVFGNPASYLSSGLFYNRIGTPNGLVFTTNGNVSRMVLDNQGNLAVGYNASPGKYRLKVSHGNYFGVGGLAIEKESNGDIWEFNNNTALYLNFNDVTKGGFNSTTGAYTALI